jgi:hypothetical protein
MPGSGPRISVALRLPTRLNDHMSDDQVLQDVRNWLNQNGYVLEMEVAQQLLAHCPIVVQGLEYIDPITDKLRETDVYAAWISQDYADHFLELAIECKSTSAPWIAFYGGSRSAQDAIFPFHVTGNSKGCNMCDSFDDFYSLGPGTETQIAYSIMEKKTAKGDRDLARDAVLAVNSAAVSSTLGVESRFGNEPTEDVHRSFMVLPTVVTKSPIFACSLDAVGQVDLSRVDSCWVLSHHEKLDLPIRTLVINYTAFKTFVWELAATCDRLGLLTPPHS